MAEITLYEYTEQIREALRLGRPAEAIEMCRHSLHHYPKYITVYVLLGQALLDLQDHAQAGDILALVLAADPENVVAYVGLSLVYEKDGLLDEAIWCMERAFEINPNNVEIRKELMRLRGHRDGIGRYRIKLTSGALGRLYAQGDLYTRAIQEFEAVLRQEPARQDILLAKAEVLWRQRHPGDALDLCQQILERAPNCLKANLLQGKIWQEMGMADDGHRLLQLAQELDPDNQVAQDMFENQSPLPPRRVTLPLPRQATQADLVPAPAAARTVAPLPVSATLPEWMRADVLFGDELAEKPAPPPAAAPAPAPIDEPAAPALAAPAPAPPEPDDMPDLDMPIPDWMREALADARRQPAPAPKTPPPPPVVEEPPAAAILALPAWLADVAPALAPTEEPPAAEAPDEGVPAWLAELDPQQMPGAKTATAPEAVPVISSFLRADEFQERLGALLSEAGLQEGEQPADDLYDPAGTRPDTPSVAPPDAPLGISWAQETGVEHGELPSWLDESAAPAAPVEAAPESPPEPAWTPPPWLAGAWSPVAPEPEPGESEPEPAWAPPPWLAAAPAPAPEPEPVAPEPEPGESEPEPAWAPPPWLAAAPAPEPAPVEPEPEPEPEMVAPAPEMVAPEPELVEPAPAPVAPPAERFAPLEPLAVPAHVRLAPDMLEDYVEGLLAEPNDYYARLIVASAYQDAAKYELALEHYESIIQAAPSLPEQIVTNLEQIAQTAPHLEAAHRLLGDVYLKQGRYEDAQAQYRQALEWQPS